MNTRFNLIATQLLQTKKKLFGLRKVNYPMLMSPGIVPRAHVKREFFLKYLG